MNDLIFEEVDGQKIKFKNLIKPIRDVILDTTCVKELCERSLKWHADQKEIDMNFIECENGTVLWWHSDKINSEKNRMRHLIWTANRADERKALIAKYRKMK